MDFCHQPKRPHGQHFGAWTSGRHFISGRAAKLWDRYDPDWIPTQNLGHNKCDAAEKLQADLEAAGKRDERVRDREKRVAAENEKRLR